MPGQPSCCALATVAPLTAQDRTSAAQEHSVKIEELASPRPLMAESQGPGGREITLIRRWMFGPGA